MSKTKDSSPKSVPSPAPGSPGPGEYEDEVQLLDGVAGINVRTAKTWQLALIAFFVVSGGPVGFEQAVKSGGVALTLIGLIVFPILWALPAALMTAELSTMMPQNGGFVIWCERAFGTFGGWMNGYNSIISSLFDIALYPALFISYMGEIFEITPLLKWIIIVLVVAVVVFLNIYGVELVGSASGFFVCFIMLPFLVMFFGVLFQGQMKPWVWTRFSKTISWRVYINIMFWNFSGWDNLGCIAGEVQNPRETYPRAVMMAIVFTVITYLIPTLAGSSIDENFSNWDDGHFSAIGSMYFDGLGHWISIAAGVSSLGIFNATMASLARAVWKMADFRMLPSFFGKTKRGMVPVNSIFALGFCTIFLSQLDFEKLVEIDNFIYGFSLFLEKVAFIYLRYTEPQARRPYVIPGGLPVAWIVTIFPTALIFYMMSLATWEVIFLGLGLNVIFAFLYLLWKHGYIAKVFPHCNPNGHRQYVEQVDIAYQ